MFPRMKQFSTLSKKKTTVACTILRSNKSSLGIDFSSFHLYFCSPAPAVNLLICVMFCLQLVAPSMHFVCRVKLISSKLHLKETFFKVEFSYISSVFLKDGMSPLLWAAHIGDKDGIDRLLSFGADVNRQLKVWDSPMHEIFVK